jgi:leucyl-tRNA synthetase
VVLPEVDSFKPDGTGKGPLARAEDWVHVWLNTETGETKPFKDGQPQDGWVEGWRETDTMDGFACSSWYFLRFADPDNKQAAFDAEKVKFWLPVDDYIGGAEHAVMHLLYARMWTKVMFDDGLIDFNEPFKTLRNHGMILAPDGRKMSKSWGNVIAPDEIIEQGYGADAIRLMELFIGPWNQSAAWSVEGMGGCFRFLQRVWTLVQEYLEANTDTGENKALTSATHKAIKKVSQDMHDFGFNTSIAALMEFVNELYKIKAADGFVAGASWKVSIETLLQLLAPYAPHMTEELWQELGHQDSIHTSQWPEWDEQYLVADSVTIVVQINGKVRSQISVSTDSSEADIVGAAKADSKVAAYLDGKSIRKTIFVPGKLVSFVI